jgi:hypothetical protein
MRWWIPRRRFDLPSLMVPNCSESSTLSRPTSTSRSPDQTLTSSSSRWSAGCRPAAAALSGRAATPRSGSRARTEPARSSTCHPHATGRSASGTSANRRTCTSHLHGTRADLDLIVRSSQLRHALMAASPALRLAVVKHGKIESLLNRDQLGALLSEHLLGTLRPPQDFMHSRGVGSAKPAVGTRCSHGRNRTSLRDSEARWPGPRRRAFPFQRASARRLSSACGPDARRDAVARYAVYSSSPRASLMCS